MSINEHWKYLRITPKPYARMTRQERSQMLDEAREAAGLERKTLIQHVQSHTTRAAAAADSARQGPRG